MRDKRHEYLFEALQMTFVTAPTRTGKCLFASACIGIRLLYKY